MNATAPKPTVLQTIPMYGSPCAGCGRPAHAVHVMPHGRLVMHSPQDSHPCRVTGLTGGVS